MPPHESRPTTPAVGDGSPGGPDGEVGSAEPAATVARDGAAVLLDFGRTARRLAVAVGVIGVLVVTTWTVLTVTTGASLRLLGELAGLGLLCAFLVEVVVVGGSAVRGMLRAGERGERLAAPDVSLVPPQLLRRRRR